MNVFFILLTGAIVLFSLLKFFVFNADMASPTYNTILKYVVLYGALIVLEVFVGILSLRYKKHENI
jgi:Na+(H+)/acetate symporter ActP